MCWKISKSVRDEIDLYLDVTSVFFDARGHTPLTPLEIPWSYFARRMEMAELFLNLAMFWNMFKSLLDEFDIYVDVTRVFLCMHVDTLH